MKVLLSIATTLGLACHATGFATSPLLRPHTRTTTIHATVPLKPEPEGGEELTKVSSSFLPNSRMKNMGLATDISNDGDVFNFWLSAVADGDKIKKFRVQTEKEASKKANFPGFRKVRPFNVLPGEIVYKRSKTI